ncbi:DNA ligase [Leucothrix arctica]|uniref:DNA ligase n=1 Tax=Leucothrix arctica TaxID=1481894 RepID=A0A317C390_9GAMM|nr:DNA ligase [Leucothrix arctica]PWQ93094.1 DNA ligase [Leucothrix arctica]
MNIKTKTNLLLISFLLPAAPLVSFAGTLPEPELLLAKVYKQQSDISGYFVSEKYDGVRAYWDGEQFISRQGNIYHAPAWFTKGFPDQPLDGELWIARNHFEKLLSAVTKDTPIDSEWQQVSYRVFELPNAEGGFAQRLARLKTLLSNIDNPVIHIVEQYRLESHELLMSKLTDVVKAGAEGLMLHHESALYQTGRSDALLKVKRYEDAEARVIKQLGGKGKYLGMMGALLLETPDGTQFKIGSGFSDLERQNPPVIGSTVTYKYYGKTNKGKPKFASFLRVRAVASEASVTSQ